MCFSLEPTPLSKRPHDESVEDQGPHKGWSWQKPPASHSLCYFAYKRHRGRDFAYSHPPEDHPSPGHGQPPNRKALQDAKRLKGS